MEEKKEKLKVEAGARSSLQNNLIEEITPSDASIASDLQTNVQNLKSELTALKLEQETKATELENTRAELSSYRETVALQMLNLAGHLRDAKGQNEALQTAVEEKDLQLITLHNEVEMLRNVREAAETKLEGSLEDLEKRLEETKRDLGFQTREKENLEVLFRKLKASLEEKKDKLKVEAGARDSLQNNPCEEIIPSEVSIASDLQRNLQNVKSELTALKLEQETKATKLENTRAELSSYRETVALQMLNLAGHLRDAKGQNTSLQTAVEEKEAELATLQKEVEQFCSRKEETKTKLKQSLEKFETRLDKILKNLNLKAQEEEQVQVLFMDLKMSLANE
mmetsp:Transcript_11746/g.25795  ORF Transcript_11746/g.25795 Transcript_11746/m.25795 type:complete len:339 (-) Transcript_11746:258-1274(-)